MLQGTLSEHLNDRYPSCNSSNSNITRFIFHIIPHRMLCVDLIAYQIEYFFFNCYSIFIRSKYAFENI